MWRLYHQSRNIKRREENGSWNIILSEVLCLRRGRAKLVSDQFGKEPVLRSTNSGSIFYKLCLKHLVTAGTSKGEAVFRLLK